MSTRGWRRAVPLLLAVAGGLAAPGVRVRAAAADAGASPEAPPERDAPGRPLPAGPGHGAAEDSLVEALLARMSTRDKAAQMVMPWVPGGLTPGESAFRRAERWAVEERVGGFIVGKGDREATTSALRRLQRGAAVPLLMASDLEWGAGMRLLGATLLPPAMAVGATGDTGLAYVHGLATAGEARSAGLHVALAPSLDVNVNPANPIINTRSFGGDPRAVAAFGAAWVRGLQDGGLLAVGKHFPGHGDTDQDSHLTLPSVDASRARLDSVELAPFRAAVRAGIGGVLVGHIAVPALTGGATPASLSPAVITGLLRRDMRFEGLVFTDALNMAGVARRGTSAEVALLAVRAGADILLQPPEPERAIAAIARAVEQGTLGRARLDASVRRILRAKARVGLLGDPATPVSRAPVSAARLADSIATRSITLLRDSAALLPLRSGRRALVLVFEGSGSGAAPNAAFEGALRASGVQVTRRVLSARTAGAVADSLATAWAGSADGAPLVIVSSYNEAVPWRGAIGLPAAVAGAVERIARRAPMVHVAFGDPYVIGSAPSASTALLAWSGTTTAQRAAARALVGTADVSGRLPITMPPTYGLGAGRRLPATGAP